MLGTESPRPFKRDEKPYAGPQPCIGGFLSLLGGLKDDGARFFILVMAEWLTNDKV